MIKFVRRQIMQQIKQIESLKNEYNKLVFNLNSLIYFVFKLHFYNYYLMQNYDQPLFNLDKNNHQNNNNFNYYQEYCRLYLANIVLTSQMKQLMAEKNQLKSKLAKLEERNSENDLSDLNQKQKRHRRTANQIHRHYKCSIEICQKSYGSEGSLNQHIKLKHPQLFATMSQAICSKEQYEQEQGEMSSKINKKGNTKNKVNS